MEHACHSRNQPEDDFVLELSGPLVASRTTSGRAIVRAGRHPVDDIARVSVTDAHNIVHEPRVFRRGDSLIAELVVDVSGEAVLRLEDAYGTVGSSYLLNIQPGPVAALRLGALPPDFAGSVLVHAAAMDAYGNFIPGDIAGLELRAGDGATLAAETVTPTGGRAVLTASEPALVTVSARAADLTESIQVLLPEVELACRDYLILDDNHAPLFPVDVRIRLAEGERLRSFAIGIELNELTAFHHLDTTPAFTPFGAATVELDGPTIRLTGGPYEPVITPLEFVLNVARFWCSCEGVGESLLTVTAADFVVAHSPDQPKAGTPRLWKRGACVNKRRVKKLCVNPIVFGNSWTAAEILHELQVVQDNLDAACCTVTISMYGQPIDNLRDIDIGPNPTFVSPAAK